MPIIEVVELALQVSRLALEVSLGKSLFDFFRCDRIWTDGIVLPRRLVLRRRCGISHGPKERRETGEIGSAAAPRHPSRFVPRFRGSVRRRNRGLSMGVDPTNEVLNHLVAPDVVEGFVAASGPFAHLDLAALLNRHRDPLACDGIIKKPIVTGQNDK